MAVGAELKIDLLPGGDLGGTADTTGYQASDKEMGDDTPHWLEMVWMMTGELQSDDDGSVLATRSRTNCDFANDTTSTASGVSTTTRSLTPATATGRELEYT